MSVIPTEGIQPSTPPPAEPAAESTVSTIEEYNQAVSAELEGDMPDSADDTPPAGDDIDPVAADEPNEGDEELEAADDTTADEGDGGDGKPAAPIVFADTDTPEEIEAKKAAVLENVDLTDAPEVQALIDFQAAKIAALSETVTEIDGLANKDTIVKFGSAVNRLYETEIDPQTGEVVVNTAPIVEFMRTDLKDEFPAIAEAIFSSDSTKYQGASLFEEMIIDSFGAEKAAKMVAFGFTDAPLPVMPANMQLPTGIDEKNAEAYAKLPAVKQFEIQSLVDEINELQADMKDATEWRKEELAADLNAKREKLDAEIFAIEQIQRGYNQNRQTQEVERRQQAEVAMQFRNQVNTEYNKEIFGMADAFAQDIAPRLTYADDDTQLSHARNLLSRVNNALAFQIGDNGELGDDPMAAFYAEQLKAEGVKFDFGKGVDLLKAHYKATEKLEGLRMRRASPQAIQIAEKEKSNLMFQIKTEQKALLGQLSTKYVKSNGSAVSKKIDEIKGKKQPARKIVSNARAVRSTRPANVVDQIAEYNRKVQATTGEELFDQYQQ